MTKTLAISYTPRKGSYTKILFDEFIQLAQDKTEIKCLDLVETPPDLLLAENLNLIMEWNMGKRDFSEKEQAVLANHHRLIDDILEADHLVLTFPIYNFTMPAAVKAWIDAVVVSDKTFSFSPERGFQGMCQDKKALSIMVGGFDYSSSGTIKEYATSTVRQNFDFMGFQSEQITAFGVDQNRAQLPFILKQAKAELTMVVDRWFLTCA